MRFTLTGVFLIMGAVLALAVGVTHAYRRHRTPPGADLVVVLFKSRDGAALRRAFEDGGVRGLEGLRNRGASFIHCAPPAAWYPSVAAALLTGLHPSECRFHRAHPRLPREVETLAERLSTAGFDTLALLSAEGRLEEFELLQGFHNRLRRDPALLSGALAAFMEEGPAWRNRFVFIEVDLDDRGGPAVLGSVLTPLLEWMETRRFFRRGVLLVAAAPCGPGAGTGDGEEVWERIPVILAGDPMRLGPGKCYLRRVDLCTVAERLEGVALGQGFDLRDARRTGLASVMEDVVDPGVAPRGEVNAEPPRFRRIVRFDDLPGWVEVRPGFPPALFDGEGRRVEPGSDPGRVLLLRYRAWLAGRRGMPGPSGPEEAGLSPSSHPGR